MNLVFVDTAGYASTAREQIRQGPFGANVVVLHLLDFLRGFHIRSDRQETIQTKRVIGAVLVLRMVEHWPLTKRLRLVDAIPRSGSASVTGITKLRDGEASPFSFCVSLGSVTPN